MDFSGGSAIIPQSRSPVVSGPLKAIESAELCYEELGSFDVTTATVQSTVDTVSDFLQSTLQALQVELLEMTPLKTDAIVVGVESLPDSPGKDMKRSSSPKARRPTRSPGPKKSSKEESKPGFSKSRTAAPTFSTQTALDTSLSPTLSVSKAPPSLMSLPATAYLETTKVEGEHGEMVIMASSLDVFTKLLDTHFTKVTSAIRTKLTEFLDERVTADRTSLHHARNKAQKQLFVAREMSELFRRSYDHAHRQRESEAVRLVELELRQKFTYEILALKKSNKQLETTNKILTKNVETLEATIKESEPLLQELRNAKKAKNGKSSKQSPASHHPHHGNKQHRAQGHGHGDATDQGSHASDDGSIGSQPSHNPHNSPLHEQSHHSVPPKAGTHAHAAPFHAGSANVVHSENSRPHSESHSAALHVCHSCEGKTALLESQSKELQAANVTLSDDIVVIGLLERKVADLQLQLAERRPFSPVSPQVSISVSSAAAGMTNFGPLPQQSSHVVNSPLTPTTHDHVHSAADNVYSEHSPDALAVFPNVLKDTFGKNVATSVTESDPLPADAPQVGSSGSAPSIEQHDLQASSASDCPAVRDSSESPTTAEVEVHSVAEECLVEPATHSLSPRFAEYADIADSIPKTSEQPAALSTPPPADPTMAITSATPTAATATATVSTDELLSVRHIPDHNIYTGGGEDGNRMPQIDSAGSIVLPEHPQFGSAFDLASPSVGSGGMGKGTGKGLMSLDLGSLEGISAESAVDAAQLEQLTNMTSGVGFLPSKYVESIQAFFADNEKFFGKLVDVAKLKLTDVFSMLQERVKAHKESQTQLLSLEFQNSQSSERIRTYEAALERQEKLHSLQLLERGVLLRELASQVNTLRSSVVRMEAEKKIKHEKSLAGKVKGVKSKAVKEETARPEKIEFQLPNVKIDLGVMETGGVPPIQAARDRLLQSSLSMPLLSDEYGPVNNFAGSSFVSRIKSRDGSSGMSSPSESRVGSPMSRAHTAGAGQARSSSAAGTKRGMEVEEPVKILSAFLRAALPLPEKGASPEEKVHARLAQTNFVADLNVSIPTLGEEKLAELKAIRAQILGLVTERYPRRKTPTRLATTLAARDAQDSRAIPPNPKSQPSPIAW